MMLAALWGRVQGWALMALAVVAVLVGAYAAGGRSARRSAQVDQLKKQAEADIKGMHDAREARNEIDSLSDDTVRDRARRRLHDSKR